MVEAVVEYDYKAQEPDELSLKKGDVLGEIRMQPGGWWEGVLARTGKRGMFPDNFVRVIDLANSQAEAPVRKSSARRCKVLFSYEPANDDELELKVDDIIEILTEVEEGWWRGKLRSKVGVFPSNFVAEINDDPKEASRRKSSTSSLDEPAKLVNTMNHDVSSTNTAFESEFPPLPPKPVKEMCRALFAYDALNDDELSLQKGDLIILLSRENQDAGWWKGELRGKIGMFPDNFVQEVPSNELTKPARPPVKVNNSTTNRVRDSITKPAPLSSSNPIPLVSAHRKSIELPPKPDEKLSPPGVSKKPVLPPPPLKKPVGSRSPSSSTVNKPPFPTESKQNATTPTKQPESPTANAPGVRIPLTNLTASLKQSASSSDVQSSQVDTSRLSFTTGPKRSESTDSADGSFLSRNSASYSVSNHTSNENSVHNKTEPADVDLDCVSRTAMLTHPTASRVRAPRRRPPSTVNSKESPEGGGLMNGNVEPHFDNEKSNRASFVQELKMSQAKKNASIVGTRVMIGTSNSSTESTTVIETTKISPGVTLRNLPVNIPRPHSMLLGGGTVISPRGFNLPTSSPETVTVTAKQFSELMEKISRLESQHESYQQAIKDLNNKLNEEVERRIQLQLELEKLTDLVTQV